MSRALVTGASGFIGGHLVRRLLRDGDEVHAASRTPAAVDGADWAPVDLTDADAAAALVERVRPHVIYHVAGLSWGSRDLDAVLPLLRHNLVATVNVLVAAVRAGGCRVVMAGSLESPERDAGEAPTAPYGAAKHAAGAYARMFSALYGLPVVDLRIFMAYGPRQQDWKVVPAAILALLRGEAPRLSSASRPIDWIYVDDVVAAFVAAGRASGLAGETIDVGSGAFRTVREVVEEIGRIMEADIEPEFGAVPDRLFETVRIADTGRAKQLLGFEARTSLHDGLGATVEWYRSVQDRTSRHAEVQKP